MRYGWMLLTAMVALSLAATSARCGEADDVEEYEAVPEGFEERRYILHDLGAQISDLSELDGTGGQMDPAMGMNPDEIMGVIRHAAGAETWTKRGAARMSMQGGALVVLQKKEVHDEIAKVLAWLREGAAQNTRTTLVIAALKPEQLAKIETGTGVVTPADLFKMIEEAGENSATITDLRGREGQQVVVGGNLRLKNVREWDVSGSVYSPVMRTSAAGVVASARVMRSPDAQSARVDLETNVYGSITAAQAEMRLRGVGVRAVTTSQTVTPDKKDSVSTERHAGPMQAAELDTTLKIETPRQALAAIKATVIAPRGQFVLAGVLDFSAGDGKGNDRRAVLVRADAGAGAVPSLVGVSGLKEGEVFKLYPLGVAATDLRDNAAPVWGDPQMKTGAPIGPGPDLQISIANPFDASAGAPMLRTLDTQSIQARFSERVRKNKLVEGCGQSLFTRLTAEDHAKLLNTVAGPVQSAFSGVRVRAVVLALSQSALRKVLLEDAAKLDDAAVAALLATPNAARLADASLVVQPNQLTHAYAGKGARFVSGYEISGDMHDPVVSGILEQGYVLEARYTPQEATGAAQVAVRFRLYPGGTKLENAPIDTVAVGSATGADFVLRFTGDLAAMKIGVVNLQGAVNAPKGQYVLASSAPMPADPEGKSDPRQAVLLLRVEDSAKP